MNYYFSENKQIKLYNDDCLIIMQKLLDIGMANKIDLIVCDPPYKVTSRGSAGNSGGMCQSKIFNKGQVFKNNNLDCKDWFKYCYELLKDSGHCYIMCNHINLHNYLNVAKDSGFHFIKSLIWNKGNKIMGQYYMSQFEYILFFRKGKGVKINNCGTSDILNVPNIKTKDKNGNNIHDTEKPVELMKILIENSSKENEVVLDFACGVGSTLLACQELNRQGIGCEIDENYYNIAIKRLKGEPL